MPLWAKIDVDTPVDPKLFGQPVVTRWLWLCLITLAKQQDEAGAIRGYDCALLSSRYNLPRKGVAEALTHYQRVRMVELDVDGTIRLINFKKRQGPEDTSAERSRRYYDNHRETVSARRRVSRAVSDGVSHAVSRETVSREVEKEEEVEKRKERDLASPAEKPPAPPPTPFVAYVRSAFPSCAHPERLEARSREAWPGVDMLAEAKKARVWEETNPARAKRNKAAFLARWFDKAQERGPRINGTPVFVNGAEKPRVVPTADETQRMLAEKDRQYQEGRWRG